MEKAKHILYQHLVLEICIGRNASAFKGWIRFDKICPVQCSCLGAGLEQLHTAGQPIRTHCHTYYGEGAKIGPDKYIMQKRTWNPSRDDS